MFPHKWENGADHLLCPEEIRFKLATNRVITNLLNCPNRALTSVINQNINPSESIDSRCDRFPDFLWIGNIKMDGFSHFWILIDEFIMFKAKIFTNATELGSASV